jgi:hypothetical protein
MARATRGLGRATTTLAPAAVLTGQPSEQRPSCSAALRRSGLRRVDWVRLTLSPEGRPLRAEAVGVAFRLPVTCPISLATAAELVATGTPHATCVEHEDA